jgi:hypothetical protein
VCIAQPSVVIAGGCCSHLKPFFFNFNNGFWLDLVGTVDRILVFEKLLKIIKFEINKFFT